MASVLIISPYRPECATKGCNARLAKVVEHLFARGLEIDFLHVGRRREPIEALPIARRCLRRVHHATLKHRSLDETVPQSLRDATRPSKSLVLRQIHRWRQKLRPAAPIEHDIAQVIRQADPDIVWIDHTPLATILPRIERESGRLWIVDTHDVMHLRDESRRRAGLTPDFDITRGEEIRILERFHVAIAIQDAERTVLHEAMLPDRRVLTVGHALPIRPLAARRPTVSFVGSKIDVNVQGLVCFIEQAWPAIAARCPQARLEVVGTVCRAAEVAQLAARSGGRILLRGTLPNPDDIYDGPAVMICPLWAGSGLKIKMAEALAYGKATVTTPVGAQGLEEGAGKAFLVASSRSDFVEPVLRLLGDAQERRRFETAAAALARRQFSQHHVWRGIGRRVGSPARLPRPAAKNRCAASSNCEPRNHGFAAACCSPLNTSARAARCRARRHKRPGRGSPRG